MKYFQENSENSYCWIHWKELVRTEENSHWIHWNENWASEDRRGWSALIESDRRPLVSCGCCFKRAVVNNMKKHMRSRSCSCCSRSSITFAVAAVSNRRSWTTWRSTWGEGGDRRLLRRSICLLARSSVQGKPLLCVKCGGGCGGQKYTNTTNSVLPGCQGKRGLI